LLTDLGNDIVAVCCLIVTQQALCILGQFYSYISCCGPSRPSCHSSL